MRLSLYRAELRYGGGLVLHTAASGSVPVLATVERLFSFAPTLTEKCLSGAPFS